MNPFISIEKNRFRFSAAARKILEQYHIIAIEENDYLVFTEGRKILSFEDVGLATISIDVNTCLLLADQPNEEEDQTSFLMFYGTKHEYLTMCETIKQNVVDAFGINIRDTLIGEVIE